LLLAVILTKKTFESRKMNNRYIIRLKDPVLKPGLSIETESSERYVVDVAKKLMDLAREINGTSVAEATGSGDADSLRV
jgi:hypothetical protein